MADAGYFRGTSAEQDNRFSDKEKKLLKQMRFADSISTKVEMAKVHLESLKPWISQRISELLGMEDDVLQEFVFNQLEADKFPDGRRIQINLTGFLNGKNARIFTGELWDMLIAAQESASGIPAALVTAKKEELRLRTEEQERLNETLKRTVSRFQDKLRNDSPPPYQKTGRTPSPSRVKSENVEKPSESRRKDESQSLSQNRRQYRSRRSASGSPAAPEDRQRSRSRERDTRGKRDTNNRNDRYGERRDRTRRSRTRSPPHRRYSPPRSRLPQQRREYGQSDRSSYRKPRAVSPDRTRQLTRSPSPDLPTKEVNDGVEPDQLVTTTEVQARRPEASPARSSDSETTTPKGRKRASPTSPEEGSPDQSKKNKKKNKKHKKHKKHKKSKKDEEDDENEREQRIATKFETTKKPPDDLEKALREKALESMKRAIEKGIEGDDS